MLTIGSLFSGIGGLELGLERAGLGPVKWQVEIDDYCNKVLEKHWPDSRRYRDIYEIQELEPVELICGGFPCQPVSCAGGRKAQADDRWLWPEFLRIISEVKPRWVVAENVPGLLSIDSGRTFGRVFGDIAQAGYDCEWGIISAASVGAPHLRQRIFIIAHPTCISWENEPVSTVERGGNMGEHVRFISAGTWNALQFHWEGTKFKSGGVHSPSQLHRVADGLSPELDRLKCLGNAVVPQVAEVIGLLIMEHERVMTEGA